MKNTFAVITCNRLFYLRNCVESIREFIGLNDINLLIIDNASSENGVSEYLSSLPNEVEIHRFGKRHANELHRAMNYAIKYARSKKSDYVNFIQDDYQYVYNQPDLLKWVDDAFSSKKKVVQLHTNLIWKFKAHKIGKVTPLDINGTKWFYLHNKPPCDNGFTKVSLYKKIGLYPSNVSIHGEEKNYIIGETWFAKKCKGKYRMLLGEPNMGMIPDCAFIRGDKRKGKYFSPPSKFYLKPFDESEMNVIRKRSKKNKLCFIEDLIIPDGWKPEGKGKHSSNKMESKI